MGISAATRQQDVSRCLGAAYALARNGSRDLAVSSLRAAIAKDPELRQALDAKRQQYAALVSDANRHCHVERTVHEMMEMALSAN